MRFSIPMICCCLSLCSLRSAAQTNYDDTVWQMLKKRVADKSLIALGEEGHGYESINKAKVAVIGFLHREAECKAIAFESSFTIGMIAYLKHDSLETRLKRFLYPFWNTPSVVESMKMFEVEEVGSDHPLIVGFDVQEDCRFLCLSDYLLQNGIVKRSRAILLECDSILSYYIGKNLTRHGVLTSVEHDLLADHYNIIKNEIEAFDLPPVNKKLLLRIMDNRAWLCKYLTISRSDQRMYYRDSVMAENVDWLMRELYKGKKLIVWAANLHITTMQQGKAPKWMGEWLSSRYPASYFACGFGTFHLRRSLREDELFRLGFYPYNTAKFDAFVHLKLIKIEDAQWKTPCD